MSLPINWRPHCFNVLSKDFFTGSNFAQAVNRSPVPHAGSRNILLLVTLDILDEIASLLNFDPVKNAPSRRISSSEINSVKLEYDSPSKASLIFFLSSLVVTPSRVRLIRELRWET